MTLRNYISEKLRAFGVTEAQLLDISILTGLSLNQDVEDLEPATIGVTLAQTLEELVLAPKMSNVSEQGFSMSWDFSSIGKYYVWLCKRWGIAPDASVLELLGVSNITDHTNIW